MESKINKQNFNQGTRARHKKHNKLQFVWRVLLSWLVVFIVGGLIGGAIGYAAADAVKPSAEEYGTRDGRSFISEASVAWVVNDDFVSLDCTLQAELQEFTFYLSKSYYIDFSFVMGLMYCESSFQADCVSETKDYGLMQINACNHDWFAKNLDLTDMIDPYQNIHAGLYILRSLFEKYDDPAKVCMAYHMGEHGASLLWEQGIYETTYSRKVFEKADEFKAQIEKSTKK